jgi:modulator of FtsH protease
VTAYDPSQWTDFALAQLGASAALLGLVFVGLSINLKDVIGSRQLVNRAGEAVIALGSVLVTSTAVLIPDQSRGALATELLLIAGVTFSSTFRLQIGAAHQVARSGEQGPPRASIVMRRVLGLGAPLLLAVAGVTLAAQAGGGLYWWPGAIAAAYLGALTNAWVLLVEILR